MASTSLDVLVEGALEHLKQLGYTQGTLRHYRRWWSAFIGFVRDNCTSAEFSVEAVEKYLAVRGVPSLESGPLAAGQRNVRLAMRVLTEFALHGYIARRRCVVALTPLPVHWQQHLDGYERYCTSGRREPLRCLRNRLLDLRRFLHFLETRGIHSPGDIDAAALSAFVGVLTHLRPKTLATTASHMRAFLRYLSTQGTVCRTLADQVPKVRVVAGGRLPTIWTAQNLQALFAAVDRASPAGKRDYTILLLAARLGMRAGDIRALRLEQLDWDRACIHLVQSKTGVPLDLPLPDDVAEALIDYLRHGRPQVSHREVFLRQHAPFQPFGSNNEMYSIISTYRRRAGIELPKQSRRGLHSLRHTFASRLLEAGVPLDTIAGALGHVSPETTRSYLRIDVNALRTAALDPEDLFHE
ncbi:MAG: site-specific integrase [Planctomycetaceae bacterium]